MADFYPRSPCGERRKRFPPMCTIRHFYPRSPCGERLFSIFDVYLVCIFLSTLSLRRATVHYDNYNLHCVISIHALLAESDDPVKSESLTTYFISIHALLAESDIRQEQQTEFCEHFYPRSPCGERRRRSVKLFRQNYISIHALLAESDHTS